MPLRKAEAEWKGNLTEGSGNLKLGSGAFEGSYSFASRFGEGEKATNPEELIAAAHAGCFTMAVDAALTKAGFTPTRLHTTASVRLDKVGDGFEITGITLELDGDVPDIAKDEFDKIAHDAKANCPVSKALAGTKIELHIK
ncbi:MAG TPA: OsmC family protein [Pyrinomonadaceae bacterium]|nr:OsmC family protein [Pyrinomonadaceae bacterium]